MLITNYNSKNGLRKPIYIGDDIQGTMELKSIKR